MTEKDVKDTMKKDTSKEDTIEPNKDVAAKEEKDTEKKPEIKKAGSFAVIATGGKQYVVREGDFLTVEKLDGEYTKGDSIEFSEVLLVDNGKTTTIGEPIVPGAKVSAEFIENARQKKISVIRFRSKSRYFKNRGHRQPYTQVKITKIA